MLFFINDLLTIGCSLPMNLDIGVHLILQLHTSFWILWSSFRIPGGHQANYTWSGTWSFYVEDKGKGECPQILFKWKFIQFVFVFSITWVSWCLISFFTQWVPSLVSFISVSVSFFLKESMFYLPIILFGIYTSWIYLRYFQKRLEAGLKGDPSDEFSFSSFFPEFLRY
jgi:hypothetical protein